MSRQAFLMGQEFGGPAGASQTVEGQAAVDVLREPSMNAQTAEALLAFAADARRRFRSLEAGSVFVQLEQEYPAIQTALRWFVERGKTDQALRLAMSLAMFWMATRRLAEGESWFRFALDSSGGTAAVRGEAVFQAGLLAFWQGDDARASALHHQALEMGRQAGEPTVIALALTGLARIALRSDVAEARRLCREAVAVTEGTIDRHGRANAIHVLGVAAQMAGDFQEARQLMRERIELARETEDLYVISSEAGNLSMVERQLGNLAEAEALAREALSIDYQRRDHWAMPYKVSGLAAVATERKEYQRAAVLLGAAEAMMAAEKAGWPPDERPHYEWMLLTLNRELGPEAFEQVRRRGQAMAVPEAVAFALQQR